MEKELILEYMIKTHTMILETQIKELILLDQLLEDLKYINTLDGVVLAV